MGLGFVDVDRAHGESLLSLLKKKDLAILVWSIKTNVARTTSGNEKSTLIAFLVYRHTLSDATLAVRNAA
ncbi:hypothetical protein AA18890_3471 [Komagataeibacter europaeus LMG 18890]|nr:hypothetical protein AA18890_3471 [Komagataeibacter europaeus LMG 18890]